MRHLSDSFRYARTLIALLLLLVTETEAGIGPPPDRFSPELTESMQRWGASYTEAMAPVRRHLGSLVQAIHEGRISDLPDLCPDFRSVVGTLDRSFLATAADPVIRGDALIVVDLLQVAAVRCRRDRFFALSFQLYKVGYLLEVVDRRLSRFRTSVE